MHVTDSSARADLVMLSLNPAATSPTLAQKDVEIGRHRLGSKLAHHQRYLPAVIRGMIRHMLHQMGQAEQRVPGGKQFLQGFGGDAVYKIELLSLDIGPLPATDIEVGKCSGRKQSLAPGSQIRKERVVLRRRLPKGQPSPLARKYVKHGIPHGTEAAAQIAGELLKRERFERLKNAGI